MPRIQTPVGLTAHVAALLLGATSASAQVLDSYFTPIPHAEADTDTNSNSQAQALNRYTALGVRVGSVLFSPELDESVGYNSNIDGRSGGNGSTTVRTTGSVRAAGDWSRSSLFITSSVDNNRFLDEPRQNYTNWDTGLAGSVDVGHDTIVVSYTHSNVNQLPGSINTVTFVQPVPLRVDAARLGYVATQLGRFTISPELRVTHYDSDDFNVGGVTFSQAYRDRTALQPGVTVRYQLAPQRDLVFVVQGTHLAYQTGSQGLPKRDSDGIAVLGGLDYPTPDANVRFRALFGVQTRQFVSSVYTNQTAPTFELSATWTPTRLTTVTLSAQRQIDDAADEAIAAYTQTSFRLSVDHELRRNVVLRGYAEMQSAEFQASRINTSAIALNTAGQAQSLFGFGVGANWQLNRNIGLGVDYGFSARRGGSSESNYVSNVGLLTVRLRL